MGLHRYDREVCLGTNKVKYLLAWGQEYSIPSPMNERLLTGTEVHMNSRRRLATFSLPLLLTSYLIGWSFPAPSRSAANRGY
jgi:hypothetical protein